jgi:hypothetical protein
LSDVGTGANVSAAEFEVLLDVSRMAPSGGEIADTQSITTHHAVRGGVYTHTTLPVRYVI